MKAAFTAVTVTAFSEARSTLTLWDSCEGVKCDPGGEQAGDSRSRTIQDRTLPVLGCQHLSHNDDLIARQDLLLSERPVGVGDRSPQNLGMHRRSK